MNSFMVPGRLNLPTVWRGCDYPAVVLKWKDQDGHPMNLTGLTPFATFLNGVNLNPVILDAANGVTEISMTKDQTKDLRLGEFGWDWIWQRDSPVYRWPPMLAGTIQVKEPETNGSGS